MKWIMMVMSMVFGRYPAKQPPVHNEPVHLTAAPDAYWENRFNF